MAEKGTINENVPAREVEAKAEARMGARGRRRETRGSGRKGGEEQGEERRGSKGDGEKRQGTSLARDQGKEVKGD